MKYVKVLKDIFFRTERSEEVQRIEEVQVPFIDIKQKAIIRRLIMKFEGFGFEAEINDKDYNALEKVANSDLVGFIGGDWLKYWRWRNLVSIADKFRKKCEENNFDPQQVAPKFLSHFFDASSQEDDESLQDIWAKILYSESRSNGSVSLKTLHVLKLMTSEDAKILNNLFQYVIQNDISSAFLYKGEDMYKDFQIKYIDLLRMEELGLLVLTPFLGINPDIDNEIYPLFTNRHVIHCVNNLNNEKIKIEIPIYMLTKSGLEIFKLENHLDNLESLKHIVRELKSRYPMLKISLHEIKEILSNGEYKYEFQDLMEKIG